MATPRSKQAAPTTPTRPSSASPKKNQTSDTAPPIRVANSCRYHLEFPIRDNMATFAVVPAVHQFLEMVYQVNPAFHIHSTDEQGVISSLDDIPTTEHTFRQCFEIHSNFRRIMVGFNATSTMPIGTLKKGTIFDYLHQHKIWFGEHKFQTLKLRECGSLYKKHPQWTHRGHLTANIQKHLAAVYSEVTESNIGSGAIPYFEIRQQDLVHRNRDTIESKQTFRTTALTIWCDAIHTDHLQQILMDHLEPTTHGRFIPTGSTSGVNDTQRAELIDKHNQWLDTTMCIKVRNCSPAAMNAVDTNHQSLLLHLSNITTTHPQSGNPSNLFRSVEPTRDVHTTGRYFFLVDKQLHMEAIQYIDQHLLSDYQTALNYTAAEEKTMPGQPRREGPRNIPDGRRVAGEEHLSHSHMSYRSGPRRRPPTVVFTKEQPPTTSTDPDGGPHLAPTNAWRQGPPRDTDSAGSSITPRRDNGSQISRETISEISTIFTQFSAQLQESERRHKQQQEAQQQFTRDMLAAQQQFQTHQMTQLREITGQFTSLLSTLQPVLIAAATQLAPPTQPNNQHPATPRPHTRSPVPSSPASEIIGQFSPIREAMEITQPRNASNHPTNKDTPEGPPGAQPKVTTSQTTTNQSPDTSDRLIPTKIRANHSKSLSPITPGRSWADMDEEDDDGSDADKDDTDPISIQDSFDISQADEFMSTGSPPRRLTKHELDNSFATQQADNRDQQWRQVEGKPRRRHRSSHSSASSHPRSPPSMRPMGRGYGGRGG